MLRTGSVACFICWFGCHINHSIAYLTSLLTFFLTYLLLYLSSSVRTGQLCFQARGCKKRPNLPSAFLCSFCVVVYFVTEDACLHLLCLI